MVLGLSEVILLIHILGWIYRLLLQSALRDVGVDHCLIVLSLAYVEVGCGGLGWASSVVCLVESLLSRQRDCPVQDWVNLCRISSM